MIRPHGADALQPCIITNETERAALLAEAEFLPSMLLNSAAAANTVMLGAGYFSPLTGFMNLADILKVASDMQTSEGYFWPVPVANFTKDVSGIDVGRRIALRDPNVTGHPIMAVMQVESIEKISHQQLNFITEKIFGTLDNAHPGVATFRTLGQFCVAGDVQVFNFSYFQSEFPSTFKTAAEIREEIKALGWKKVVAFQTRNPMHRAHEELCRMAKERLEADGIIIHMLLGRLKEGDIPAPVRGSCIRKMADVYFPKNTVMVNGYGFDMLYAGPREALLHAVFRQNMGATHLIVGRDHAGVSDFYGPFDAQTIFDTLPENALEIEIFAADHTAYSKKLKRVVMMREAPDHLPEDYIILSGTKVRQMLSEGISLPPEFARPEVAEILMEHYRMQVKQTAVGT